MISQNAVWRYSDKLLFSTCVLFFLVYPQIDLNISKLFFNSTFYMKQHFLVHVMYDVFAKIHILYLLILLGCIWYFRRINKKGKSALASCYLLACLLVGPGLLVNIVLKDNSVGRPRPVHIQEFNGDMDYAPAFRYSGQCEKNCSFVSGHASVGFYMMALYWVTRRRIWLIGGILLGGGVGFARMLQGGHFLSDIIFSGWATYFSCCIIHYLFRTQLKFNQEAKQSNEAHSPYLGVSEPTARRYRIGRY